MSKPLIEILRDASYAKLLILRQQDAEQKRKCRYGGRSSRNARRSFRIWRPMTILVRASSALQFAARKEIEIAQKAMLWMAWRKC